LESPFIFLSQAAVQVPLLLVWIVGMILALLWWQRAPRVALITCVACGVFLLDALIGTFIAVTLPGALLARGQSSGQIGAAFTVIGLARSVLHAALWAAVLFAIFSGRVAVPTKQ
jgi:hypothetical protein